jgi:hypothetical protein
VSQTQSSAAFQAHFQVPSILSKRQISRIEKTVVMKASPFCIPVVIFFEPKLFSDEHIYLVESCNLCPIKEHTRAPAPFNSLRGGLRERGHQTSQQALPVDQAGVY